MGNRWTPQLSRAAILAVPLLSFSMHVRLGWETQFWVTAQVWRLLFFIPEPPGELRPFGRSKIRLPKRLLFAFTKTHLPEWVPQNFCAASATSSRIRPAPFRPLVLHTSSSDIQQCGWSVSPSPHADTAESEWESSE